MGGGAFTKAAAAGEPTLRTPRMSCADYNHLKAIYTIRLQSYFPDCAVSCLIEAPQKADHGDLDFIIGTKQKVDNSDLARQLGARGVISLSSGDFQKCTLAVPTDGSKSASPTVLYQDLHKTAEQPSEVLTEEAYAQIDIEIIPPERFEWHMFYASYSDMAGLIGKFVRYYGFSVTDKGLLLRLRELDEAKGIDYIRNISDDSGRLTLSQNPDRVMRFLGLLPERFHQGFNTIRELYEWLGECRLLSPDIVKYRQDNSRERNREKKRTIYTNFLDDWLPAHFGIEPEKDMTEEERLDSSSPPEPSEQPEVSEKRLRLQDEAIEFFDKQEEYRTMHAALTLAIRNQTAAHLLRPILARHVGANKINEVLRAFKRWVVFPEGKAEIASSPHSDEESQLHLWLADRMSFDERAMSLDWMKEHWEELKGLERQRLKSKRTVPPS